ncbi:LysE family transporter [Bacillus salitolerans]|uniref:LysE family transporter n=1 Tax=Bacillus salitolerans TaxID=1437434 RepID=A0ABW4LWF3_9BACI
MSVFLSYIFLGLSLAAPIGPINAAQLDRGIKNGFFHAWLIGLGSVVADIIYMCLVYLGMVHFIEIPIVKAFLWSFGFFVLTYTGIESMISAGQIGVTTRGEVESKIKTFLTGFLMALSNPLTILFWLGIYGSIIAKTASNFTMNQLATYSFAIILGLLLWDVSMAALSSSFRNLLTTKLLKIISILSGLSLIGFGLYFGIQAYLIIF